MSKQAEIAGSVEQQVRELISRMTLAEKIGQMRQLSLGEDSLSDHVTDEIRAGRTGSVLNVVCADEVRELQRIAVEESRLGIPLLFGRDVIHGFKTVMPIPLGQAATWNPELVKAAARVSALEAAACGVNWTFAPMIDVSRDARWGRIAESFGEDTYLTSQMGVAAIRGYQGENLAATGSIAACAKHFAGYGASEAGRDYATTNIPENELRNVYLGPFRAAIDAGVSSVMASFSDLNGVPASANDFLMTRVLRHEWQFDGIAVSDFNSISQLCVHGIAEDDKEAACLAVTAGIDVEMAGDTYVSFLEQLIEEERIEESKIDAMVANVLRVKFRLGLFEAPAAEEDDLAARVSDDALRVAKEAALQSVVLLKNEGAVLPLAADRLASVAVIGPLADAPYEQLGTWIFDGDPGLSVDCLSGIRKLVGDRVDVNYVKALANSRSRQVDNVTEVMETVGQCDVAILFLGEESILSGEAHSRADINLPGAQAELVKLVRQAGKPLIAVILAGRPLTLSNIVDDLDAILYAWHPGAMGGEAIAELLFGQASPSGKLPATFPRMVGQVPIYYNHKNTGKPPIAGEILHIDDIEEQAPQTSY
ncbi:MAG TPA: glycoside hydrolase family 3 N-terminal domain-containing protein [Woeseiaceae bacterium]